MVSLRGARLYAFRMNHDLSRTDVADLTGVAESTVRRIEEEEHGESYSIGVTTAVAIAEGLYVDVMDLFDPRHLSHLGRPAKTGRPIEIEEPREVCDGCYMQLPLSGACPRCEPPT